MNVFQVIVYDVFLLLQTQKYIKSMSFLHRHNKEIIFSSEER